MPKHLVLTRIFLCGILIFSNLSLAPSALAEIDHDPQPAYLETTHPESSSPDSFPREISHSEKSQLNALTKEILKTEIAFDSLNQKFRLETALTTRWRQRRLFTYSEANAFLTEASQIEAVPLRYKLAASKDLHAKERSKLATAASCQLTGQSLSVSADVFEMSLNYYNYLKLKRHHFDPQSYRQKADFLETQLDKAIATRHKFLSETQALSPMDARAAHLEGLILNDYRNIVLNAYVEYHAATKRFWVLQNTSFLVDLAKNSTGAAGNIIGLTGNHWRRPRIQGGSGVMSIITGAIVLTTPAVGRITSNVSALAARRLVSKSMQNVSAIDTSALLLHRNQLAALVLSQNTVPNNSNSYLSEAASRLSIYEQEENLLRGIEKAGARERKRAHANLVENVVFAGVVGPARVANGITQIVGGWRYYGNRAKANRLYAAGATGYLASTGANIFETARIQTIAELGFRAQDKTHNTQREQIQRRLKTLDEMKTSF